MTVHWPTVLEPWEITDLLNGISILLSNSQQAKYSEKIEQTKIQFYHHLSHSFVKEFADSILRTIDIDCIQVFRLSGRETTSSSRIICTLSEYELACCNIFFPLSLWSLIVQLEISWNKSLAKSVVSLSTEWVNLTKEHLQLRVAQEIIASTTHQLP